MGIGVGVFLAAIGAVLAFAVQDNISDVDLTAVGYILMVAGVVGVLLELMLFAPRRRAGGVVEERRVYDEPRR
ncbi:hypothetical protein GCM10009547_46000 [Sporichthya brevicatena]|uniref:DUF6458 domain-containing protein n=1 Tax=Sporichthya brevicatena TaxID=171442 RepID=A0ABN1HCD2_9ACTN